MISDAAVHAVLKAIDENFTLVAWKRLLEDLEEMAESGFNDLSIELIQRAAHKHDHSIVKNRLNLLAKRLRTKSALLSGIERAEKHAGRPSHKEQARRRRYRGRDPQLELP